MVSLSDNLKPLLANHAPYLQPSSLIFDVDCFYPEIYADSGHMGSIEAVFTIAVQYNIVRDEDNAQIYLRIKNESLAIIKSGNSKYFVEKGPKMMDKMKKLSV